MEKLRGRATHQVALHSNLLFVPVSRAESIALQTELFNQGYTWLNGSTSHNHSAEVERNGIALVGGIMYPSNRTTARDFKLATLHQLKSGSGEDGEYMNAQFQRLLARIDNLAKPSAGGRGQGQGQSRTYLQQQFDRINTRLDGIAADIAEIKETLGPRDMGKPKRLPPPVKAGC